jgi:hypothetical protein
VKSDAWRWWVVALLPKPVAKWLWSTEWIKLGSWAPYVLGQSIGRQGKRVG